MAINFDAERVMLLLTLMEKGAVHGGRVMDPIMAAVNMELSEIVDDVSAQVDEVVAERNAEEARIASEKQHELQLAAEEEAERQGNQPPEIKAGPAQVDASQVIFQPNVGPGLTAAPVDPNAPGTANSAEVPSTGTIVPGEPAQGSDVVSTPVPPAEPITEENPEGKPLDPPVAEQPRAPAESAAAKDEATPPASPTGKDPSVASSADREPTPSRPAPDADHDSPLRRPQ